MRSLLKAYRFLLIPTICSCIIFLFVLQVAIVPTNSMSPAASQGCILLGIRSMQAERGDIIVFKKQGLTFVKRIIGVGGDSIRIANNHISINGTVIDEPYVCGSTISPTETWVVPDGSYFVLGDNRADSTDSRNWEDPFIYPKQIKSRVFLVIPTQQNTDTKHIHFIN